MSKPKSKVRIVKYADLARMEGFDSVEAYSAACDADAAAEMKLEMQEALLRRYEARKARRAIARNREWSEFSARLWAL